MRIGSFRSAGNQTLFEQGAGIRKTLGRAMLVKIENGEWNGKVFLQDGVAELGPIAGKLVNVGLNEEELLGIKRFQILVEYLLRQGVVERHPLVVVTGQQFSRQVCRLSLLLYRLQLWRIRRSRVERCALRCRRQGKDYPQQFLFHSCSGTTRECGARIQGRPSFGLPFLAAQER